MPPSPESNWRVDMLSEKEFVALPQAEREEHRTTMLRKIELARALASEINRRGSLAIANDKPAEAAKYIQAMQRLAAANRGPNVTLLLNLIGESFARRAGAMQAEFDNTNSAKHGQSASR